MLVMERNMANGNLIQATWQWSDAAEGEPPSWRKGMDVRFPCPPDATGLIGVIGKDDTLSAGNVAVLCNTDEVRGSYRKLRDDEFRVTAFNASPCKSELDCGEFYHPDAPATKATGAPSATSPAGSFKEVTDFGRSFYKNFVAPPNTKFQAQTKSPALLIAGVAALGIATLLLWRAL